MGFIGTTEVMPCYKAPIACACIGFSAACNAQAHFVNFIGPAEAVPLLQSPFARVWTGFSQPVKPA